MGNNTEVSVESLVVKHLRSLGYVLRSRMSMDPGTSVIRGGNILRKITKKWDTLLIFAPQLNS